MVQILLVQFQTPRSQYPGHIPDLPIGFALGRPFQFGQYHILGAGYVKPGTEQLDLSSPLEFLLAERPTLLDYEIHLPAGFVIDDIEPTFFESAS